MTVTTKEKREITKQGFARTGGIPRQTYWTPDGRKIEAIASMREYNRRDENGDVVGTGTRDANLDKGWLLQPLQEPKPYCVGCDKWHDTDEEVMMCIANKEEKARKWEEWARKEKADEAKAQGKEIEDLRVELYELKGLVHELTQTLKEVKNG